MAALKRPCQRVDFEIAIVCAVRVQVNAVQALFDEFWEGAYGFEKAPGDPNAYSTGRIGVHHVVLAFMPGIGKGPSAHVAASLRSSFPEVKLCLMVGTCGGVPLGAGETRNVYLGDVVISTGIVQYDFGRQYPNKSLRKDSMLDSLPRPNAEIRSFLAKLGANRAYVQLQQDLEAYIADIGTKDAFKNIAYPGAREDKLFQADYRHKHHAPNHCQICDMCYSKDDDVCVVALESTCAELGCDDAMLVTRERSQPQYRNTDGPIGPESTPIEAVNHKPAIHFGLFASGDQVIKSAFHRDKISAVERVIAFEMEGAGVWDVFPTIMVKGVCNYADSHKNKDWQAYSAACAAACTKAMLKHWIVNEKVLRYRERTDTAKSVRPPVHLGLRNRRVPHFVGREDAILALDNALCSSHDGPKIAVLQGMEGQGKTQVAREYCKRKKNAPFQSIFWLDASSENVLRKSFDNVATALRAAAQYPLSQEDKVPFVLQELGKSTTPWLLVFDNFDNVDAFSILDYFPDGDSGAIIVTSRNTSTEYLVNDPSTDFIQLSGLEQTFSNFFALTASRRKVGQDENESASNVFTTWELSFQQLQNQTGVDGVETSLVTMLSLFDCKDISEELFRAYPREEFRGSTAKSLEVLEHFFVQDEMDGDCFAETLASIAELSLIQLSRSGESGICHVTLHPLITDWIRLRTDKPTLKDMHCMVDVLLGCFIFGVLRSKDGILGLPLDVRQQLLSHSLVSETNFAELSLYEVTIDRALSQQHFLVHGIIGIFLYQMGLHHLAEPILERTLPSAKETFGGENVATLNMKSLLGSAYLRIGRLDDAEELQVQLVELAKKGLGENHEATISYMSLLADIYRGQGKQHKAKALHIEVFEMRRNNLGEEHLDTLWSMLDLAPCYLEEERWREAGELIIPLTEIRKRNLDVPHSLELRALNLSAQILGAQERLQEAEAIRTEVVARAKMLLGDEHPDTMELKDNLAVTYAKLERFEDALELHLRVTETQARVLGPEHPDTLTSMKGAATTYASLERFEDALELHLRVIEARARVLGPEHPDTLRSMEHVAVTYVNQDRFEEAEALETQIIEARTRILGESHPDTVQSVKLLATCYGLQGRKQEAEALMARALGSQ